MSHRMILVRFIGIIVTKALPLPTPTLISRIPVVAFLLRWYDNASLFFSDVVGSLERGSIAQLIFELRLKPELIMYIYYPIVIILKFKPESIGASYKTPPSNLKLYHTDRSNSTSLLSLIEGSSKPLRCLALSASSTLTCG
jgi:hypothetical protein